MNNYHSEIKEQQRRQTFDKYFLELSAFLTEFGRMPEKSERPKLYSWMEGLMTEHKRRRLKGEYVDKLNSIGFIWNKREFNWYSKVEEVKKMLIDEKCIPSYNTNPTLYYWLNSQLELLSIDNLLDDKKVVIENIKNVLEDLQKISVPEPVLKISAREIKWTQKLNALIEYKQQNPKTWPQVDASDENEKKLGIWCQDLRHRYRKNLLEEVWTSKLLAIEFNFEGRLDNWKERFDEFKEYLKITQSVPNASSDLYSWGRLQYKNFSELNFEKQELLNSINFLNYFEEKGWDKRFEEVKEFLLFYKKAPTKKSNPELYNWLSVQRAKSRNNLLTNIEQQSLLKLGIDLNPIDKREEVWDLKFETLVKFREKNPDRWPSYFGEGIEKRLYEWCQAQRQVFAKTAKRRKDLSQDRIDKLNQIDFHWSLEELIDKNWDITFNKLADFINENNGSLIIPTFINDKYNSLYTWLRRQKIMIKENKLTADKIEKLQTLGVI